MSEDEEIQGSEAAAGSEDNNEHEHEHEHEHRHSHSHRHKSKAKPVLYSVLAFFLAFALFLLSCCAVLHFTVFSKDYMLGLMRNNGYYEMVRSELQSGLENLVDASGFNKQFSEDFARSYDIQKAVEEYISSFYSGDSTLVNTVPFKQQLYSAIDVYIADNNITVTDETRKNISYFVNEATQIYVAQISIPFFSTIANYIYKARNVLNIVTVSLGVFALVIVAVIFFTNSYKHRRFRYLFMASSGAALAVLVLPTLLLLSDKVRKINLETRSIYSLFVNYFNTLFYNFYIWAGVLTVISVILFVLYVKHYKHVLNS